MTARDYLDELFDEFVTAYGSGRNPDVREYLQRAGAGRAELGALIDSFLAFAPVAATDEEARILVGARVAGRTPIAETRAERQLSISAVVEQLRERLGLSSQLSDRLRQAYEDLEKDWLDPGGVHASVWEALRGIFGIDVRGFVGEEDAAFAGVLMRRDQPEPADARHAAADAASEPEDEIDRLFRATSHP